MRKFLLPIAVMLLQLMLSGCGQLTQVTLSEQQVNLYLQKHNNFEKKLDVSGLLSASIRLDTLSSQIGRNSTDSMVITGTAHTQISSLFGSQQAEINLTLLAKPSYDAATGAIFMKDMVISDYHISPEKMQGVLQGVMPLLNKALTEYFNQKPVYVLDEEHSKSEALARKLAKGLEVKSGELVIHLN
jgi:uncharacterized protein YceK